jgi:hypothetical protein
VAGSLTLFNVELITVLGAFYHREASVTFTQFVLPFAPPVLYMFQMRYQFD